MWNSSQYQWQKATIYHKWGHKHQLNAIPQVRNYVNACKSYNCSELITKPTRITPSSSTLIDYMYTTLPLDKVTPGILINDLSDHLPIFVVIKPAHVEKLNTKP